MESWAEALAMMTTEPLLLHSEVKKEELDLHHHMCSMEDCSPADSSLYSPTTTGIQLELELSQEDGAVGVGLMSALDGDRHAAMSSATTGTGSYHSTTSPSIARSLSSPDDLMDSPPPPPVTATAADHLAQQQQQHIRRLSGEKQALASNQRPGHQRSANRVQEANLLSEEADISADMPRSAGALCRSRSYSSPEPDEHHRRRDAHHHPGSGSSSERTGSTDAENDAKHHYHHRRCSATAAAASGEFNHRQRSQQQQTTQQQQQQQQQQSDFKDEDAPKRLCLVCGDVASGFHYGVASCEACKAFFKRTIQGNIEYTCPAANDCEINKRRRKACQACRFQKCIRMGMLKEGVRLDRVRGGRQKYRRVTPYATPATSSNGSLSTASAGGVANPASNGSSASPDASSLGVSSAKKWSIEDNKILSTLEQCEPEMLTAAEIMWPDGDPALANLDPSLRALCTLSELYDRELVAAIGWAKQIPGFLEMPLNDQMRLLQTSWPEVLSLSLAFRSMPLSSTQPKLQWSSDFFMTEKEARECGMEELFFQCVQIAQRLEQLSVSKEEYLLLKALVLINCDVRVESFVHVKKLRETILAALNDCTSALRPGLGQTQMFQLLLCMPCIRQVDSTLRRFWSLVRRDSRVPMNKLFLEMLESPMR